MIGFANDPDDPINSNNPNGLMIIYLPIININITVTYVFGGHTPYGPHHVVPLAVSLASVYASPVKPVVAGVYTLPAHMATGRLSVNIGRES